MAEMKYASIKTLTAFAKEMEERYAKTADVPKYKIQKKATADAGFAASYQLFEGSTVVGDTINIPKDYLVKSASVKSCSAANQPVSGLGVGDKYLDFVVNTVGDDGEEKHIYISVKDMVTNYTAGNGINITDSSIAVKIDSSAANGLSVGASGLGLALATASTAGAMSASDKVKVNAALTEEDFTEITESEVDAIFESLNS